MNNDFFEQIQNGVWQPPKYPSIDNPKWKVLFDNAIDAQEKVNIANAWLWRLNQSLLHEYNDNDQNRYNLLSTINQKYQWLREILPLVTNSHFEQEYFDGTVEKLLKRSTKSPYTTVPPGWVPLSRLWFGKGAERISAIEDLVEIFENLRKFSGDPPKLLNLIENLAWDVVKENPFDISLRSKASRISSLYGLTDIEHPSHESLECYAWHMLARSIVNPALKTTRNYKHDIFSTIRYASPVVACENIVPLMYMVRENIHGAGRYYKNSALTTFVDKQIDEIGDYDILRAWVPDKTAVWDSAEALEMPFDMACITAVNKGNTDGNQNKPEQLDVPYNLS